MTTQQMLDERYGRRGARRARGTRWVVVAVLALGAIGYLGWVTVSSALGSADVDVTGFNASDPHSVEITFQVTASPGVSLACALEAQDVEHGVVGWKVVEYPPLTGHAQAFTESIPVVAKATTGLVNSCWVQ
jgi:hypothetical protein